MSRNVRRRLTLPEDQNVNPAVVRDELEEFSGRLNRALLERGWSASELARRVWKESKPDSKGYMQVRGKDRISSYLRSKSLPEPKTLAAIARELSMAPEDLAPSLAGKAIDRSAPEVEMKTLPGHADRTLLRVSKLVPLKVALRVIDILSNVEDSN